MLGWLSAANWPWEVRPVVVPPWPASLVITTRADPQEDPQDCAVPPDSDACRVAWRVPGCAGRGRELRWRMRGEVRPPGTAAPDHGRMAAVCGTAPAGLKRALAPFLPREYALAWTAGAANAEAGPFGLGRQLRFG
jgi:hypothetical protein